MAAFKLLPGEYRVKVEGKDFSWTPLSEFAGVIGDDCWHDKEGKTQRRSSFYHVMKGFGYYEGRRSPDKDGCRQQKLGLKAQNEILETLFGKDNIILPKKTNKKNGEDKRLHFRKYNIFGWLDGLMEDGIVELKTSDMYQDLSTEDLQEVLKDFKPTGTAFWQAMLPAYYRNKKEAIIVVTFPTREDYMREHVEDPKGRSIILRYSPSKYKTLVKKAMERHFSVMRDARSGLTPEYDPDDPKDMRLVSELQSQCNDITDIWL